MAYFKTWSLRISYLNVLVWYPEQSSVTHRKTCVNFTQAIYNANEYRKVVVGLHACHAEQSRYSCRSEVGLSFFTEVKKYIYWASIVE